MSSLLSTISRTMTRSARSSTTSSKRSSPSTPTFSSSSSTTAEMPPPLPRSPNSNSNSNNNGHPPPPSPSPSPKPLPLYLCRPFVDAALVKGNFKTIVMLPKYVDIMEWVAVNVFDFYTNLNEFYGIITDCCTQSVCPKMSAGGTLNYTWINHDRKSVQLAAPTYIDYVLTWCQNLLNDENTFPTKAGQDFPPGFPSTVKHMYRQLLRVFAHIYHAHFQQILHLRSEPHFNSLFAHFLSFGKEYELLDIKDVKGSQTAPVGVGDLWEKWKEMGILDSS